MWSAPYFSSSPPWFWVLVLDFPTSVYFLLMETVLHSYIFVPSSTFLSSPFSAGFAAGFAAGFFGGGFAAPIRLTLGAAAPPLDGVDFLGGMVCFFPEMKKVNSDYLGSNILVGDKLLTKALYRTVIRRDIGTYIQTDINVLHRDVRTRTWCPCQGRPPLRTFMFALACTIRAAQKKNFPRKVVLLGWNGFRFGAQIKEKNELF